MNSIAKRYIYKSGLDIIAPLKCGTRWLEDLDVENRTHRIGFDISELSSHIHSGTTFIWRPVREHMISAIKTELVNYPEKTPFDIITEMEHGTCDHWYPYLYKELYSIWEKTGFQFYKLRALSELTPSAKELKYISTSYNFRLPTEWDSVESILNSLSPKHKIRLERLIGEEEKWLKLMIEPQYSGKSWEAYSDLEDEMLKMKCKVMDLEVEVSRITNSKWAQGFHSTIRELRELNAKLQHKIDYAEKMIDVESHLKNTTNMVDKPIKKLI
jgi:hypothetical protein